MSDFTEEWLQTRLKKGCHIVSVVGGKLPSTSPRAEQNPPVAGPATLACKRRRRSPWDRCTKTERRFCEWVLAGGMGGRIPAFLQPHAGPRLVFPDWNDSYSPDVFVQWDDGSFTLYEVKGGYRGPGWEQGWERFKRACSTWPSLPLEMWEWDRKKHVWVCRWPLR